MDIINYQMIKKYFWYHEYYNKKYNKCNMCPIFHINTYYYVFCDESHCNDIKNIHIKFTEITKKICKYKNTSCFCLICNESNKNNIIDILQSSYYLILIDGDESLSDWNVHPKIINQRHNKSTLINESLQSSEKMSNSTELLKNTPFNFSFESMPETIQNNKNYADVNVESSMLVKHIKQKNNNIDSMIINDYCNRHDVEQMKILTVEIDSGSMIRKSDVVDENFVLINRNIADF